MGSSLSGAADVEAAVSGGVAIVDGVVVSRDAASGSSAGGAGVVSVCARDDIGACAAASKIPKKA